MIYVFFIIDHMPHLGFIYVFVFVFGLIIGSFLNCLVWRLHKRESMLNRSYCPKCLKGIFWHDNIPLFSFIFLRGRCRHCRRSISWQYPAVEIITAVLFCVSFFVNLQSVSLGDNRLFLLLARDWLAVFVLTVIFIYDLRWYLIPDIVTLPSVIVFFIINTTLGFDWKNLLISGIIGGGFFLAQYAVSRGKWIGGGDIRLGLLMGVLLGWPFILLAIMMAYVAGSFVGIALIAFQKKDWKSQIPLGTFLSVSSIVTLFWGEQIITWYWNLII